MRCKIQCDVESKIFYKFFWKLNKTYVLGL